MNRRTVAVAAIGAIFAYCLLFAPTKPQQQVQRPDKAARVAAFASQPVIRDDGRVQQAADYVNTITKQTPSFEACLAVIQKTATDTGTAPVNIVETTAMRMVRFPVADGSIIVTCLKDGKLKITQSSNRCGVDVEC